MIKKIVFALLLTATSFNVQAEQKSTDKGDPLSLAALLIKDSHYHKAQLVLEETDTTKKEFDFKRYYTLFGISALNIGQYSNAVDTLQKALDHGATDQRLYVYLSQAAYRMEDFPAVVKYVDQSGQLKGQYPSLIFMKYEAQRNLEQPFAAWNTLKEGEKLYPENEKFIKQQVFTLIQLGFYQEAADLGLSFSKKFKLTADDYIAIGAALSRTQNAELGAKFLEIAKLKYPDSVTANKSLANHYSHQKHYYSAARLMETIAIDDPNLITEAAELNKLSGQYFRTLFLNSRSTNQFDKLKQRLALFLEFEEYEKASLMEKDLHRNNVLEDDNVRYALAYSHFKSGKYDLAEKQLNQIKSTRLLSKANQIRMAILDCKKDKWMCL